MVSSVVKAVPSKFGVMRGAVQVASSARSRSLVAKNLQAPTGSNFKDGWRSLTGQGSTLHQFSLRDEKGNVLLSSDKKGQLLLAGSEDHVLKDLNHGNVGFESGDASPDSIKGRYTRLTSVNKEDLEKVLQPDGSVHPEEKSRIIKALKDLHHKVHEADDDSINDGGQVSKVRHAYKYGGLGLLGAGAVGGVLGGIFPTATAGFFTGLGALGPAGAIALMTAGAAGGIYARGYSLNKKFNAMEHYRQVGRGEEKLLNSSQKPALPATQQKPDDTKNAVGKYTGMIKKHTEKVLEKVTHTQPAPVKTA